LADSPWCRVGGSAADDQLDLGIMQILQRMERRSSSTSRQLPLATPRNPVTGLGHVFCSQSSAEMGDRAWTVFDEAKLQLVRQFLHREFRDCHHRDFFALDKAAQVFLIETGRGGRLMLVVPKGTFDSADFSRLWNAHLVDALKAAREGLLLLTPDGPVASSQ
jgi:hypothetical protein